MASDAVDVKPLPIMGHVAVANRNFILVWGGYTTEQEAYFNQAAMFEMNTIAPYVNTSLVWLYDAEFEEWRPCKTKGDLPPGTSGAGGQVIGQYMYVFGGYTNYGNTNKIYRLDLTNFTWQLLTGNDQEHHPSPRDKFMHWAYDEQFCVFGGFGLPLRGYLHGHGQFHEDESLSQAYRPDRGWNDQLLMYNTKSNVWTNPRCTGNVPCARAAGAAARVGNFVFLFGGRHSVHRLDDLHVLNMESLEWTRLNPPGLIPCGRSWHSFTPISDHHIALYGGYTQNQLTQNDMWLYDIAQRRWSPVEHPPQADPWPCRLWHSACYTEAADLIVFGGCSNDILSESQLTKSHNEIHIFRFSTHSLLRLCLDAVDKYRDQLGEDFDSLPKVLYDRLKRRHKPTNSASSESSQTQTRSCSLS